MAGDHPPEKRPEGRRRDLSRPRLIEAALQLIDSRGAAAITMRMLADAVGVTPMALYNHFSSKRDLLAAVADHVVSRAKFDGRHADWRAQIHHCFKVLRDLCRRHPGLPDLPAQDGAAPASAFAPMEVTLRALGRAGLGELDVARTYFLLVSYTLAQASYQARSPLEGLEPGVQLRSERLAGRGYAAIERMDWSANWDFDASFAFGVTLILDGVEATARRHAHAAAG